MEKKQNKQKIIERRCPNNKVLVNNKCDTQTKCGKNYLYDEQKNECNKKRVLLQNPVLGNVKWFQPSYWKIPGYYNPIVQLQQTDVVAFGSELIDNNWLKKQYKYWKKLDEIDQLFLVVYTNYGDILINRFLSDGVNAIDIDAILNKNYQVTFNPLFPIFVKHPKIFEKYIRQKSLHQAKHLLYYSKVLDESLSISTRYEEFQKKIFDKFFTKEFLEETLEQYMEKFNENLNRIINKSPKLKKEILVARGSKTNLQYDGKWINRFTSTSISSAIAQTFTNASDPNIDIYILEAGTPCIPLFMSKYNNEFEILLGSSCCNYKKIKKQSMKNVQELAEKQFKNITGKNVRYYEVSKKQKTNSTIKKTEATVQKDRQQKNDKTVGSSRKNGYQT